MSTSGTPADTIVAHPTSSGRSLKDLFGRGCCFVRFHPPTVASGVDLSHGCRYRGLREAAALGSTNNDPPSSAGPWAMLGEAHSQDVIDLYEDREAEVAAAVASLPRCIEHVH